MKNCSRPISILLFLCVTLLGGRAVAAAGAPDLYRASYQAEARADYADALAKVRQIRKVAGASYFLSLRTGWLAYLAGDNAAAEACYREAIAARPKAIEAQIGLTRVLYVAKKWHELQVACKQVLSQDGKNPTVRARLAAAQYNLGDLTNAAQGYRKLVDEYPAELDYQTGLGWALLRMGKGPDARQVFQAVLAVSPDNLSAKDGMAAK